MATSEKYFLKINPRNTVPGSNIRQVREAHVADLVQKMLANGVSTAMAVSVYEPFPDRAARDLPQDERDQLVFEIRDGAHRLAALRRLQDDPNYPEYGDDYRFEVQVVPSLSPVLERTIDAAGVNTGAHQVGAKRTFCDELWSMLRVRSDIVRRLVAYSSAFVRDPRMSLQMPVRARARRLLPLLLIRLRRQFSRPTTRSSRKSCWIKRRTRASSTRRWTGNGSSHASSSCCFATRM